jgi:SulP family sulfate permease
MFVGYGMIDFDVIRWLQYKQSRSDALITLSVIGTILFVNLVDAVGIGVVIAMVQYIRMQMKTPIVHRQSDATRKHSLLKRTSQEEKILQQKGKEIVILELRGNLFFATAENLLEIIEPYMQKDYYVILHFQRVGLIDITGAILLLQIASRLEKMGGELLLCHMHKKLGLGRKINTALKNIDKKHSIKIRTFVNTEDALLYAENAVLQKAGIVLRKYDDYIALSENSFCKNLKPYLVDMIERVSKKRVFSAGEWVFEQEHFGDSLFMVLQGEIDIRLYSSKKSYTNLARYGAGTYFGEISFLNPGKRIAGARVNYDTILLEFSHHAIMQLATEKKAELTSVLLFELGTTLGNELRYSAQEIQRLEKT